MKKKEEGRKRSVGGKGVINPERGQGERRKNNGNRGVGMRTIKRPRLIFKACIRKK